MIAFDATACVDTITHVTEPREATIEDLLSRSDLDGVRVTARGHLVVTERETALLGALDTLHQRTLIALSSTLGLDRRCSHHRVEVVGALKRIPADATVRDGPPGDVFIDVESIRLMK